MSQNSITVSELNQMIKTLIDGEPILSKVCVRGELSNYKIYPSGHHYFTLKDAESSLRCVMFKSSAARLRFRPENGMNVIVFGNVSVFPRDGAYQLYASAILPVGAGDLQAAFEQLKAKLSSEGLFDPSHKKALPEFPETIAVITSPAGAAVHDIIRILGRRWPMTKVLLLPVRVQGTEAPAEIAGAIRYANRHALADVLITGRGGGSLEDLWAFNDERVARAIYASEIPVISAVGHEPDVTIADFAADVRAATPSNGAELAVCDRTELRALLEQQARRMEKAQERRLELLRQRLRRLSERPVLRSPEGSLQQKELLLELLRQRLERAAAAAVEKRQRQFAALSGRLDALSPLKVLARGYAVATRQEQVLHSVAQLSPGEEIRLRLSDGTALCAVERIEKGE